MCSKSQLVLSSTAKKPVVLASNRGRHSSNPIKLVEWCLSLKPLELFFKDNDLAAAHFGVSPHPSPHGEGY